MYGSKRNGIDGVGGLPNATRRRSAIAARKAFQAVFDTMAKWTFVVWDRRSAVVHRPSLHSRYRFAAADPGPLIRRALLDICAVKSSILERSSLRIGEVFALL
jgi:hypothetical protein